MEKSPKVWTYIIKMMMLSIMISETFHLSQGLIMLKCTWQSGLEIIQSTLKNLLNKAENSLKSGMDQMMVTPGIKSILKRVYMPLSRLKGINVTSATCHTLSTHQTMYQDFAQTHVNQQQEDNQELITKQENAYTVNQSLPLIDTQKLKLVHDHVRIVSVKKIGIRRVYDITIKDKPEFYADWALVHNCFRYALDANWPNLTRRPK